MLMLIFFEFFFPVSIYLQRNSLRTLSFIISFIYTPEFERVVGGIQWRYVRVKFNRNPSNVMTDGQKYATSITCVHFVFTGTDSFADTTDLDRKHLCVSPKRRQEQPSAGQVGSPLTNRSSLFCEINGTLESQLDDFF